MDWFLRAAARVAGQFVLAPLLPTLRARHPRVEVEVVAEDRFVDIVAEGYEAGVRLTAAIDRDMLQVRLTTPFRFVVVGAPSYLARRGMPERPEDLLRHECFTFRSLTTGTLCLGARTRTPKLARPVRGGVVTNNSQLRLSLAEQGAGLTYVFAPAAEALRAGRLKCVLEPYAATVPAFFLYYPSRAQSSPALRLLAEVARELLMQKKKR